MQAKSGPRRSPRRAQAETAHDGVIARIAERAIDNPAMTGGLFVMALTATAIVSNAMFLQNGRHPDPFFNTRPAIEAPAMPIPRPRVEEAAPPLPRDAPEADAMPAPIDAATPVPDPKTVSGIQKLLTAKGLYHGAVDGIAGSRTRAAISAFEKSAGLPVTGEPTADLLKAMKTAPKPAAKPVPPAATLEAPAAPAITPKPVAAIAAKTKTPAPTSLEGLVTASIPASTPAKTVVPAVPAPKPAVAKTDPAAAADQARLMTVQNALNRIGYGPLAVDGSASDETADAIRRFELDNGLPITGKPGERVIARLKTIGATASN